MIVYMTAILTRAITWAVLRYLPRFRGERELQRTAEVTTMLVALLMVTEALVTWAIVDMPVYNVLVHDGVAESIANIPTNARRIGLMAFTGLVTYISLLPAHKAKH